MNSAVEILKTKNVKNLSLRDADLSAIVFAILKNVGIEDYSVYTDVSQIFQMRMLNIDIPDTTAWNALKMVSNQYGSEFVIDESKKILAFRRVVIYKDVPQLSWNSYFVPQTQVPVL